MPTSSWEILVIYAEKGAFQSLDWDIQDIKIYSYLKNTFGSSYDSTYAQVGYKCVDY